jgi:hypothetical protein
MLLYSVDSEIYELICTLLMSPDAWFFLGFMLVQLGLEVLLMLLHGHLVLCMSTDSRTAW